MGIVCDESKCQRETLGEMTKSRALRGAAMRLPMGVERMKEARARRNKPNSMMPCAMGEGCSSAIGSLLDLRPRVGVMLRDCHGENLRIC